jgi:small-conductance mechanosensitive channel/CRP-like cAMP-binding protein
VSVIDERKPTGRRGWRLWTSQHRESFLWDRGKRSVIEVGYRQGVVVRASMAVPGLIDPRGTLMADASRRLLVAPFMLACIGVVLFVTSPMQIERLHLTPDSASAISIHHASGILMFLALAWLGARVGDALLRRVALVSRGGAAYPRLLMDLLRAILFMAAVVLILQFVLGQPATGLITLSSVVIAVIGFALRNVISDVVSGIALGIEHPYRIGDWIETTPGIPVKVAEITWRTTRLVDRNGFIVVVPNGLIAGQRLINYSGGERDYRTALRVPLDAKLPVHRAKRILLSGALDAGRTFGGLLPDVLLAEYGDGAAIYVVRFRVPDAGQEAACRDAVASRVLHALHCAGESIQEITMGQEITTGRWFVSDKSPRDALLGHVDLFRGFEATERSELAAKMRTLELRAGQALVRQGDTGDCLYILAEGILDVEIDRNERDKLMDRIAPGEVFGEMSLLTGQPRSATVTAMLDSVVYEIGREDIDPILRGRPAIAEGLAGVMAAHQARNERHRSEPEHVPVATRDDLLARLRFLFHL